MKIKAATKTYQVVFEQDFSFVEKLKDVDNAFYVIDRNVFEIYHDRLEGIPTESLYLLDACEERKVIDTALEICEAMVKMNAKRNAHMISMGGGITQDVTGFAANVLYRGIAWTFVPTTLLAACDSCIGGKTSLNYKSYKNLLGTFYPPDEIIVCPSFFESLTKADLESGLGEVVKFNVMAGEDSIADLEQSIDELLDLNPATVNRFVEKSLSFKQGIIEEDEFDGGKRVLLNFAHTFGHAFEVSSKYVIPHGTAVAVGVVAANSVSNSRALLNGDLQKRVELLVERILPEIDPALIDGERVVDAIRKDKKQVGDSLSAVLLNDGCNFSIVNDMTDDEAISACDYAKQFLSNC